jgi:predicted amidohydrolase YtcJ
MILDKNPLIVNPENINDMKVLATIKEGEIVFKK